MGSIKVWTKQNENVLKELESKGRYTAKREYIIKDLDEHANLVLEVYDWLVKNSPGAFQKPVLKLQQPARRGSGRRFFIG